MIDLSTYTHGQLEAEAEKATPTACDADPMRRALAAYFRGGGVEPIFGGAPLPLIFEGRLYLALLSEERLLAVYRVRNDQQLKRLRRIPLPVAAAAELRRPNGNS